VLDYKDVQPGDSFLLDFDHPSGRIRRCHRVCDDGKEALLMIDPVGFGFSYRRECKRISAHLPLNGAPYLDGVDRLPPMGNGEDVDSWIHETVSSLKDEHTIKTSSICLKAGYNKAREKYKFTEEDILDAWELGAKEGLPLTRQKKEDLFKSLRQAKLPIAFECETERVFKHNEHMEREYYDVPKTIANSEGRTEWVGKYIYE
jgi:hypothetical protein